VSLGEGYEALVSDTVGFIRKLPHHLVAAFRATLEETLNADLLLHVIDLAHASWEEQKEVVGEVLADLGVSDHAQVLVFNKVDRLTHEEEQIWRARAAPLSPHEAVFVTSLEPGGAEPLLALLRNA